MAQKREKSSSGLIRSPMNRERLAMQQSRTQAMLNVTSEAVKRAGPMTSTVWLLASAVSMLA